jgi:mevalonate kinase
VTTFLGLSASPQQISELAYEVEKIHHGTPSGIDNAVIAYTRPVYFVRNQPLQILELSQPLSLIIADSGIPSLTREAVARVRDHWLAQPVQYETWFDEIAAISIQARLILQNDAPALLGPLMLQNHQLLQKIGVSMPQLDHLVDAGIQAGAWGAKLSGAGCGGNMIALAPPEKIEPVCAALLKAGAVRTVISHLTPTQSSESR